VEGEMAKARKKFGQAVPGYSGYYFCQAVREAFKPLKERNRNEPGTWAAEPYRHNFRVFVTCPSCVRINKLLEHPVSDDGRILQCVICPHCRTHFFPKLIGWKKFLKSKKAPRPPLSPG